MRSTRSKVTKAAVARTDVPRAEHWDIFISHSTRDKGVATRLGQDLRELGQRVWIDYENLFVGDLLPQKIGEAIRDSSTLVLLWSASAARSRWVPQELQAALAAGHAILLCVLDATPYKHHKALVDRFWCNLEPASYQTGLTQLLAALTKSRSSAGKAPPTPPMEMADKAEFMKISEAQWRILDDMDRNDYEQAAANQARVDPLIKSAMKRWPRDPNILSCAGYQRKNAVRIAKRDSSRESNTKEAKWLDEGWNLFQRALAVDPHCIYALNGLASIEAMRGDFQMAEHYCLRSLYEARHQSLDYTAAKMDLAVIRTELLRRSGHVTPAAQKGVEVNASLGATGSVAVLNLQGIAAAIPEEHRLELLQSLGAFASHLDALGLPGKDTRPLRIEVRPDAPHEAEYDPTIGAIIMKPVWIHDSSIVFREYSHHAFLHAARLRPAGARPMDDALESGIADYLSCSFVDESLMGTVGAKVAFQVPWIRNLDNHDSMDQFDALSAPQHRGQVWGGALWQLRKLRGADVVDQLVVKAWLAACGRKGDFTRAFVDALLSEAMKVEGAFDEEIRRELDTRKIKTRARPSR